MKIYTFTLTEDQLDAVIAATHIVVEGRTGCPSAVLKKSFDKALVTLRAAKLKPQPWTSTPFKVIPGCLNIQHNQVDCTAATLPLSEMCSVCAKVRAAEITEHMVYWGKGFAAGNGTGPSWLAYAMELHEFVISETENTK